VNSANKIKKVVDMNKTQKQKQEILEGIERYSRWIADDEEPAGTCNEIWTGYKLAYMACAKIIGCTEKEIEDAKEKGWVEGRQRARA
jgi:hypothetical protein